MDFWEILKNIGAVQRDPERRASFEQSDGLDWRDKYVAAKTANALQSFDELLQAVQMQTEQERSAEVKQAGDIGPVAGAVQSFGRGASLGLAPHIGKALARIPGGISAEEYEQAAGAQRESMESQHPYLSMGAEILGGVAGGMATPAGLLGRAGQVMTGGTKARRAAQAASTGQQAARGAAQAVRSSVREPIRRAGMAAGAGAAEGAIEGAANAEPGSRLRGAVQGGQVGFVAGTALGGVALPAAGAFIRRMIAPVGEEAVEAGARASARGRGRPLREMPADLEDTYRATPELEQVETALADLDPELRSAMGREVIEPTGKVRAEQLRGDMSPQADVDALTRATGLTQRELDQISGTPDSPGMLEAVRKLKGQAFQEVGDLPVTPELAALFERPAVAELYAGLQKQAADAGYPLPNIVPGEPAPFEALDRVRRMLRRRVDASFQPGALDIEPDVAMKLRDDYRRAFDKAFDEAPGIRDEYRTAIRAMEAFENGSEAFNSPSRVIAQEVQGLDTDLRRMYAAGLTQQLMDQAEKAVNPTGVLRTPKNKRIIEVVLGAEQAEEFSGAAERIIDRRARRALTEGSGTAFKEAQVRTGRLSANDILNFPARLLRPNRARRAVDILGERGATQKGIDILGERIGTRTPDRGLFDLPQRLRGDTPPSRVRSADDLKEWGRSGLRESHLWAPFGAAPAVTPKLLEKWQPYEEERRRRLEGGQ